MADQRRVVPDSPVGGAFGPNAWLVDDMYEEYRSDPTSVSESWREFFADYNPPGSVAADSLPAAGNGAPPSANGAPAATNGAPGVGTAVPSLPPPAPPGAAAPVAESASPVTPAAVPPTTPTTTAVLLPETDEPVPVPLRGAAARIAVNMEACLLYTSRCV